MSAEKGRKFWQVSRQVLGQIFSKESLVNTVSDVAETVAYARQEKEVKKALETSRKGASRRLKDNVWLNGYRTLAGELTEAKTVPETASVCRDVAQTLVRLNDGAEELVSQALDSDRFRSLERRLKQVKSSVSQNPVWQQVKDNVPQKFGAKMAQVTAEVMSASSTFVEDLGRAVDEGILDEVRYVTSSLQTQKELLFSDIRDVLFHENDKIYQALHQAYFLDEEDRVDNLNQGGNQDLFVEAMKDRLKEELSPLSQQFQHLLLSAWEKVKDLPEKAGYTVLDVLEMEARSSHPKLATELARIRESCSERLPLNKVAEITEAVNAIGSEFHRIKEVITAEGGRC